MTCVRGTTSVEGDLREGPHWREGDHFRGGPATRVRGQEFRAGTFLAGVAGGLGDSFVRGQALIEYGLIIALVAVVCVASLLLFRPEISNVLSQLGGSV